MTRMRATVIHLTGMVTTSFARNSTPGESSGRSEGPSAHVCPSTSLVPADRSELAALRARIATQLQCLAWHRQGTPGSPQSGWRTWRRTDRACASVGLFRAGEPIKPKCSATNSSGKAWRDDSPMGPGMMGPGMEHPVCDADGHGMWPSMGLFPGHHDDMHPGCAWDHGGLDD